MSTEARDWASQRGLRQGRGAAVQVTDDTLSGTTAVTMLIRGREVVVSNVGDSRCVAAELQGTELVAVDLSSDQTPYRRAAARHLDFRTQGCRSGTAAGQGLLPVRDCC